MTKYAKAKIYDRLVLLSNKKKKYQELIKNIDSQINKLQNELISNGVRL